MQRIGVGLGDWWWGWEGVQEMVVWAMEQGFVLDAVGCHMLSWLC